MACEAVVRQSLSCRRSRFIIGEFIEGPVEGLTAAVCHPEPFGFAQDRLREGSGGFPFGPFVPSSPDAVSGRIEGNQSNISPPLTVLMVQQVKQIRQKDRWKQSISLTPPPPPEAPCPGPSS